MREVATNDLSGPGDTLHKHDIRQGAHGRTDGRIDGWTRFTYLQSEEIDLYEEMSHNAYETHRVMIIGLKAEN